MIVLSMIWCFLLDHQKIATATRGKIKNLGFAG
jgi:hypothetical protein